MRPAFISACFVLCAVTATGAAVYLLSVGLAPKADILYAHYIGFRWFDGAAAVEALTRHAEALPAEAYDFERRELAAFNYPMLAAGSWFGNAIFPQNLVAAMALAQLSTFVVGLAIVLVAVAAAPRFLPAMALAVAMMAILAFLPGPHPTDHLLLYGPLDNALNLIVLAVAPGEAFSALSFWPKSSLCLIMMGALLLRWRGAIGRGYLFLATTLIFHITLGGLVILGFALMDLTLRPRQVPWCLVGPLLVVSAIALSFGQWRIFSHTGDLPLLIVGVVVTSAVGFYLSRFLSAHALRLGIVASDALVFLAATIAIVPAAMLLYIASYSGELWGPEASYIQVAARLVVLAVAVTFLALSVTGARWLERHDATVALLPLLAFVAAATLYGAAGSWWWEIRSLGAEFRLLEEINLNEAVTRSYYLALQELTGQPINASP